MKNKFENMPNQSVESQIFFSKITIGISFDIIFFISKVVHYYYYIIYVGFKFSKSTVPLPILVNSSNIYHVKKVILFF